MSLVVSLREELARAAVDLGATHEARILLEEAMGAPLVAAYRDAERPLDPAVRARLEALVARRRSGEPLQYVVGHWPFAGVDLVVDRRALIPRPETEEVVEAVLVELGHRRRGATLRLVDLGTGSGAIACAVAAAVDDVEIVAVDASARAAALARDNVARCGVAGRVRVVEGEWYEPVAAIWPDGADVVVANPPYVAAGEWRGLDPEVRDYEPVSALVAGPLGTEELARVIGGAPRWGRALVAEIGATQGVFARDAAIASGATSVEVAPDLAGRDRVLVARYD